MVRALLVRIWHYLTPVSGFLVSFANSAYFAQLEVKGLSIRVGKIN